MEIAIWIIVACEIIRAAQNMVQIMMVKHDSKGRDDLYLSMKNNDIALS